MVLEIVYPIITNECLSFALGIAVYTGQDTKMALNSKLTSNKFSTVEK